LLNIRYSQRSIDDCLSDRTSLDDFGSKILSAEEGWNKAHPLEIVQMPDKTYTSFDNRRLYVLKKLIVRDQGRLKELGVNAHVHQYSDIADDRTMGQIKNRIKEMQTQDTSRVEGEVNLMMKQYPQITPNTFGYLVLYRMHGLNSVERSFLEHKGCMKADDPYGFRNLPLVMTVAVKRERMMYARFNS
jgi:hypothetical protein